MSADVVQFRTPEQEREAAYAAAKAAGRKVADAAVAEMVKLPTKIMQAAFYYELILVAARVAQAPKGPAA